MSEVYIKGVEMPINADGCEAIIRIQPNGEVLDMHGFHIGATAIPVPDHGRLIDADALWKEEKSADALHKLRPKGESVMYDAGFLAGYRAAAQIASKMPTIIPATAKEDGE